MAAWLRLSFTVRWQPHRHSPADDRSRRSGCRCLGQGRIRLPVGELRGGKSELPPSRFRYVWPGSRLVLEGSELTCPDIVTVAQCGRRGGEHEDGSWQLELNELDRNAAKP